MCNIDICNIALSTHIFMDARPMESEVQPSSVRLTHCCVWWQSGYTEFTCTECDQAQDTRGETMHRGMTFFTKKNVIILFAAFNSKRDEETFETRQCVLIMPSVSLYHLVSLHINLLITLLSLFPSYSCWSYTNPQPCSTRL